MASTTPNKKAIVDFLWEWTESQGVWSKLLIRKIVTTESPLSTDERDEVFNYFLQSINLHSGLPSLTIVKPSYIPTEKQIELDSLSDITGVNRLAKNQKLNFSKNITIIYGENGTGKTGYSRILKTLGFSYDANKIILPNIYASTEPQSATIDFKSNGVSKTFTWDGTNNDSELENISVFDSNCVQISLGDRSLIVSPIGFHLFQLVSEELNKLTQLLNAKITAYPTNLIWRNNLTPTTPQYNFIASLSTISTEQKLTELSNFTPEHQTSLSAKETELANLNMRLMQNEIQAMRSQVKELEQLIEKIQKAQNLLTETNRQTLIDCNKEILELENKTQTGIKEIAEQKGIEFYQTTEFNNFIKAADNYIKIINRPEYPDEESVCVYCLQPLGNSAKELLKSYSILLNDRTQENLTALQIKKANLIQLVSEVETNLIFHQPSFGITENQTVIQPKEIIDYNQKLEVLKTTLIAGSVSQDDTFSFDYQTSLTCLINKRTVINNILSQKSDALTNITTRETVLKKEIDELKDRKFLSEKVEDVKIAITNHKITQKLNNNASCFNTTAISRKTSSAREELVQQDFEDIFKKELTALRKADIRINLGFGTDRGTSRITHNISRHALADILSEGEQKAIALAEFLTELQLDNTKAPVIFDDPVNSLDHNIIDEVAKRLLKLSEERQVVVFTHSVLLFNSFLYFSKQPSFGGLVCKFYNSKNEYQVTGFITEAEEEINKVKNYISKINVIINNTPKDRAEADIAEDGYGFLRSAIELLVEHEIFQGTVKRYQKNVALTNFVKVDGASLDVHKDKLNEIFERCCGFIKGHSNPIEIHNTPTVAELKQDFEELNQIRSKFTS
jgi:energy-coupling factor transporter ATP-binding protein EcfA2